MKFLSRIKSFFHTQKGKPLKWLLYGLGVFFVLLLTILVTLYLILRSGDYTQTLVSKATPFLEPLGIENLEIQTLKLDTLHFLSIDNLKVSWRDPEMGVIKLTLGQLHLRYSLDEIFNKQLTVSQLEIKNIALNGNLILPDTSTEAQDQSATMSISDIQALLQSPPLNIDVQKINIQNVVFNLMLTQGDITTKISHRLNQLNVAALFDQNTFTGHYLLNMQNDDALVTASLALDGVDTRFDINPGIQLSGRWGVTNTNGRWSLSELKSKNEIFLKDITIAQTNNNQNNRIFSGDNIHVSYVFSFTPSQKTASILEGLFPLAMDSRLKLSSDKLNLHTFPLEDARLSLSFGNELELDSLVNLDQAFMPVNQYLINLKQRLAVEDITYIAQTEMLKIKKLDNTANFLLSGSREQKTTDMSMESRIGINTSPVAYVLHDIDHNIETQIKLTPKVDINANVKTTMKDDVEIDVNQLLATSKFSIQPSVEINHLNLKENNTRLVSFDRADTQLDLFSDKKNIKTKANIQLDNLQLDGFNQPFSQTTVVDIDNDIALKEINLNLSTRINQQALLESSMFISNAPNNMKSQYQLTLDMPQSLGRIMPELKDIYALGIFKTKITGDVTLLHEQETILNVNFDHPEGLRVKGKGKITLTPKTVPKEPLLTFKGPLNIHYGIEQHKDYALALVVNSQGIKVDPLLKYMPFQFSTKTRLDWPLKQMTTSGNLKINRETWFGYTVNLKNDHKRLQSIGAISFQAKRAWQQYLVDFKELDEIGDIAARVNYDLTLNHDKKTVLELDPERYEKYRVKLKLDTQLEQKNAPKHALLKLKQPILTSSVVNWKKDEADLKLEYELPDVELPQTAKVSLTGRINLTADDGISPTRIQFDQHLKRSRLELADIISDAYLDVGKMITPLDVTIDFSGIDTKKINLHTFALDAGQGIINFSAKGNATIDGKNMDMESLFVFQPAANMVVGNAISGNGKLSLPVRLSVLNGNQISLDGKMNFDKFDFGFDTFKIDGINGELSFEEELKVKGDYFSYSYLMQTDPFQRVDFGRIQPFVNTPSITIKRIQVDDLTAGPLLANMALNQNLFRLQQFDVDLFNGKVAGQFYLDTSPGAWKIGVLSRMTGVDLREMFKHNAYIQDTVYSPVNMRMAFEFNVHKKLVEGQIDISKIKRDQLLQILEMVDPEHIDAQIASLRSALGLAHPKQVKIEMQQGLMNLQVTINTLSAPIRITGLPLSAMLQQFSEDILEVEKQFPVH